MSTSQQTATSWPAPLGRKGGLQTEHDLQDTCSQDGSALEASGFASCSGLKTCPYLSPPQQLSPHHTVNSFSPIPLPSLLSWVPQIPVVTSCSYRIYTLLPSRHHYRLLLPSCHHYRLLLPSRHHFRCHLASACTHSPVHPGLGLPVSLFLHSCAHSGHSPCFSAHTALSGPCMRSVVTLWHVSSHCNMLPCSSKVTWPPPFTAVTGKRKGVSQNRHPVLHQCSSHSGAACDASRHSLLLVYQVQGTEVLLNTLQCRG